MRDLVNNWDSKADLLGTEDLKKVRRARFQGNIDVGQVMEVYLATDDGSFYLVGTVRCWHCFSWIKWNGRSKYVRETMEAIKPCSTVGKYFELKLGTGKFRKRALRFKATKYDYVS